MATLAMVNTSALLATNASAHRVVRHHDITGARRRVQRVLGPWMRKSNAKPEALSSAAALWLMEAFDKNAAVRLNHEARRDIVGICSHFNMGEPFGSCVREQQPECPRRVAPATFPGHHGVSDMP